MTKVYEGNFRIFLKLFDRMQRALSEQGLPYNPGDGGSIDKTMGAISAFYDLKREPHSTNVPVSPHFQVDQQWIDAALEELYKFNSMGDEYVCSTVEAVIKCNGIKKLYDNYSTPLYFRGEHKFGWDLKSRIGRKLNIDWNVTDPYNVTPEEKRLLAEFQERCQSNEVTRTMVFGHAGELLPLDHSGWWSLMQHYDEDYGTRMIDLTASLYCALFFASANWDGTVDTSVDGKLYMFPYQPGRGETNFPDRHGNQLIGPEDERKYMVDDYFKVENNLDYPRFRVSPARNDRVLSQDGYFMWQPYFDQSLYTFQIFPFRIHRDFKLSILKELASMGYTRDRVLANNRFGI
ncbi:MAG: FRG domain-containing protein [Candidatus Nitrotoga sp.]